MLLQNFCGSLGLKKGHKDSLFGVQKKIVTSPKKNILMIEKEMEISEISFSLIQNLKSAHRKSVKVSR